MIPEVDRCAWFGIAAAREYLIPAQVPLLDRLVAGWKSMPLV
jgi:predicted NUDIX family NTP pyrophosphohydrolase